jgi:hypothetical protein
MGGPCRAAFTRPADIRTPEGGQAAVHAAGLTSTEYPGRRRPREPRPGRAAGRARGCPPRRRRGARSQSR